MKEFYNFAMKRCLREAMVMQGTAHTLKNTTPMATQVFQAFGKNICQKRMPKLLKT